LQKYGVANNLKKPLKYAGGTAENILKFCTLWNGRKLNFGDRGIFKRIQVFQGQPQENYQTKSHSVQVVSNPRLHTGFSTRKEDVVPFKCEMRRLEQRNDLTHS
jgi:hypothetical protein